jgi:hypothetical protein
MKSGKGAVGSSHTITVELDWVALPPLGRRTPAERFGPVDDELVMGDGDWVMLALKFETSPIVFVVPTGKLVCEDAGRTMPA